MSRVTVITPAHLKDETDAEWLENAFNSLFVQSMKDWTWIIVDDRSQVNIPEFSDERVQLIDSVGTGVGNARNTGAAEADNGPILFLDHDDWLPPHSLAGFLRGHEQAQQQEHKDFGWVVYGETDLVGEDAARHYSPPEFSMNTVLTRIPMMPIGSLHLKAAWAKVGGFKPEMEFGLEDWEYWINLARSGICGYRVEETLYKYRMHARGRRAFLTNDENMVKAQDMVRTIHSDLFKGERPMGCCGGSRRPKTRRTTPTAQTMSVATTEDDLVQVVYHGLQRGFHLTGKGTGTRYYIEGPGQRVRLSIAGKSGVYRQDVRQLSAYGPGMFEVQ